MENPLITMSAYGPFDASRKRGRDDEDDRAYGPSGFCEHRQKRHQCLPRPSANSQQKRWSDPPVFPLNSAPMRPETITPAASDCGELESRHPPWESPVRLNENALGIQQDHEMDTAMDVSSPMHQQSTLEPGPFHPEPVAPTIAGRIPTPIQPSFAAQVRGGPWSGPGPIANHSQMNGVQNLGHEHGGFGSADMIPRTMDSDAEWKAVRDRRLPSPISEGEDNFSPMTSGNISPPGHILDGGFTNQLAARLASSISISTPGDQMMDLEQQQQQHQYRGHEYDDNDIATTTVDAPQQPAEVTSAPATPSPGKKGHMRSRHTINTWTWQPGMKKSFSIGYRADCEKCRQKVPGHFNHIIIS